MKRSLVGRVDGLEREKAAKPHYIFLDEGETVAMHRNRMIASGEANPGDHFIAFRWQPKEAAR
jgi:hypothetical protein